MFIFKCLVKKVEKVTIHRFIFTMDYRVNLLKNVHEKLPLPEPTGDTFLIRGDYEYWHYGCDGFNDKVLRFYFFYRIIISLVFVKILKILNFSHNFKYLHSRKICY